MSKMMLITFLVLSSAVFAHASPRLSLLTGRSIIDKSEMRTGKTLSTNDRWGSMTYGRGLKEKQALIIMDYITQAVKKYEDDIFNNAIFIQDAIEKDQSFNGKWTIEILNQQSIANWEIAGEVQSQKWLIIMNFAEAYNWTYRIWTAAC